MERAHQNQISELQATIEKLEKDKVLWNCNTSTSLQLIVSDLYDWLILYDHEYHIFIFFIAIENTLLDSVATRFVRLPHYLTRLISI